MTQKNQMEVLIDGKIYKLSGAEEEMYLQRVAAYLNGKIGKLREGEGFSRLSTDYQAVLLQLNIADDYFKAKKQISLLEEEIQNKEKEMYDLKHELIASQIKLENTEKNVKNLQTEINENAKKIVRMETELKERKK